MSVIHDRCTRWLPQTVHLARTTKMEQPSIGSSVFPPPKKLQRRPRRRRHLAPRPAICHGMQNSGPAPSPSFFLEPSELGGSRDQVQTTDAQISPAWPRAKKRRNSNCQIACVDRHGAGQDGQDGQDGQENVARRHHPPRPPSAARHHHPPLPVRSAASAWRGERDAAHRFGPKLWENVFASFPPSSALAAANQLPLRPPPRPAPRLASTAHGSLRHMGDGGFCMPRWLQTCPRGTCLFPAFHIVLPPLPPPPGRSRLKHAGVVVGSGQVSGVLAGPRYMPILCSCGESASNIKR